VVMGQIAHQQIAVYPVERFGDVLTPNTLATVCFTGGSTAHALIRLSTATSG
jgi:hypothetical protein